MLDTILTANKRFKNYRGYIEKAIKKRYTIVPQIDWNNPSGVPLPAYILRGAWVVGCECLETVFYEPGEAFFCPNCLNATNGHQPRPVEMPSERAIIEGLLLKRPDPNTRNWLAGESTDDLLLENFTHLVGG